MAKAKAVVQFSASSGRFIGKYNSLAEAAEKTKLFKDAISRVCKGKLNSTGGYVFKYYEDIAHLIK